MSNEKLHIDEDYDSSYEITAPVTMTTEETVLVMSKEDAEAEDRGIDIQDVQEVFIGGTTHETSTSFSAWAHAAPPQHTHPTDEDEYGPYIEMCFADHMGPTNMNESQCEEVKSGEIATLRVYATEANKRAVAVKKRRRPINNIGNKDT